MPLFLRLSHRPSLALRQPWIRLACIRFGIVAATLAWMLVGTLVSALVSSLRLANGYRFVVVIPCRAAWRYRAVPVVGIRAAPEAAVALRFQFMRHRSRVAPYFGVLLLGLLVGWIIAQAH